MKPISAQTFCNKYPLNPDITGKKIANITDDLYLIQSRHKQRNYLQHNIERDENFVGPPNTHYYIPVYKLMSRSFSAGLKENGHKDQCIIAFNDNVFTYKRDVCKTYCKELTSFTGQNINLNWSRKNGEWLVDAIYYKMNPLQMRYRDGRLKTGFKNHLIRRIKGFSQNSWVLKEMLFVLQDELGGINLTDDAYPSSIEEPEIDSVVVEMNNWLDNPYPNIVSCHITNTIGLSSQLQYVNIGGRRNYICLDVNLEDHGYTNENQVWLLEDEIMINGNVYNKDEVEITRCHECNSKCVVEETRENLCVECLGRDYRIHNYSHRVEETLGFLKKGKNPNEPYIGIEMEYQVDNRNSGRLYTGDKLSQHALMKDDGSIESGFEIVSRPASYHAHMLKYESFLDDLPEFIHPHKSCGMHVHISRTAFTYLGAGKFTEFMNRTDNLKFIKLIAGRGTTNYQRNDPDYTLKKPFRQFIHDEYSERYNFVNLNNSATIELRIFASPKDSKEFKIRMQFVNAMIQYCKPGALTGTLQEQTSFGSFIKWLERSKKEFKELYTHIKESTICA